MVPVERIGLSTSPLPRERSTTEPHRQDNIHLLELLPNVKHNFDNYFFVFIFTVFFLIISLNFGVALPFSTEWPYLPNFRPIV